MLKSMKSKFQTLAFKQNFSFQEVKRISLFTLNFGGLKLNAISAALILSNFFTTLEEFGSFEYALSLGLMFTVPFNLGLHGAIPYFFLKQNKKDYDSVFYFHGIILLILFIFASSTYFLLVGFQISWIGLSITIAIIFSLQILASVISKTNGRIYQSVWLDSTFFLLLNGYNLYLFIFSTTASLAVIQVLLLIQLTLLSIYYCLRFYIHSAEFSWKKYFTAIEFGKPLVVSSLLIIGLTGSGRIFIEYFFDLSAVAIYGIYFRLAMVVVLFHQIVNIAYFKKIYASESKKLDPWIQYFLIAIIILSLFIHLLIPSLAQIIFESVRLSWQVSKSLFIALSFQMFFWICLSLFENIIARENLASAFNKIIIYLIILMISIFTISNHLYFLTITNLVLINSFTIYLAIESQLKLLNNNNIYFPKSRFLVRAVSLTQIIFLCFLK